MYCPKCGQENRNNEYYCLTCGTVLGPPQNYPHNPEPYDQGYPLPTPPEVAAAESGAVASLVLGIISIVTSSAVVGLILGPIAISKGRSARRVLNENYTNFWVALAGVITGSIGTGISAFFTVYWIIIGVVIGLLASSPSWY